MSASIYQLNHQSKCNFFVLAHFVCDSVLKMISPFIPMDLVDFFVGQLFWIEFGIPLESLYENNYWNGCIIQLEQLVDTSKWSHFTWLQPNVCIYEWEILTNKKKNTHKNNSESSWTNEENKIAKFIRRNDKLSAQKYLLNVSWFYDDFYSGMELISICLAHIIN